MDSSVLFFVFLSTPNNKFDQPKRIHPINAEKNIGFICIFYMQIHSKFQTKTTETGCYHKKIYVKLYHNLFYTKLETILFQTNTWIELF